ncbi:MAG: LPS export ABC transporter permease LptF [Gammaproteobacteria bacterium]|nr:LPS export ABC transporter permease LptF [Gammaproteobacteria bacterium]MDH5629326.1 LPS export ABC transporter permease LptF [Gammaproteobacteria bacterium]
MILRRYINREILISCAAILLVLLLLFLSGRFIKYIQLALDGSISSQAVFGLLALHIPSVMGFLLPMSFYLAVLLTFGRLYADSEMAVLKSVGVSEFQLAKYILPLALVLAVCATFLTFWVTPWSNYQTNQLLNYEKSAARFGSVSPGTFRENRQRSGVSFIESRGDDGQINRIFSVYGLDESSGNIEIQVADSGQIWQDSETEIQKDTKSDSYLQLEQGVSYRLDKQKNRWQTAEFEGYFMSLSDPEVKQKEVKNSAVSTSQLLKHLTPEYWAELHWRLSVPVSMFLLCFLAIPLARTEPRKGKFSRLLPGLMLYVTYALLMMNSRRFIESGAIPEVVGLWWVHFLVAFICYWLYKPAKLQNGKNN